MRSFSLILFIPLLALLYALSSCQTIKSDKHDQAYKDFDILYESEQFSIAEKNDLILLEIKQCFKGSAKSERYLLYPRGKKVDSLEGVVHSIPYPVFSMAISSTTHLGYIETLGMLDQVKAATNLSLYYSENFKEQIHNKEVTNLGGAEFDEEKLIQLNPDVLFAFSLSGADYSSLQKLRNSGNAVVLVNEYLEAEPLAKAAWIQFFACFFGGSKLQKSSDFLESIHVQYQDIKSIVAKANSKPVIMMGFPWKGSWHVAGGKSYQSIFFEDAGGVYLWKDHLEEGGVPLDIEVALNDGLSADIWVNPGNKTRIEEIVDTDPRFQNLSVVENNRIYSNYKRSNSLGANDYWEKGVVRPDLILKDLASIFHPELINDHELYFYKSLDAE